MWEEQVVQCLRRTKIEGGRMNRDQYSLAPTLILFLRGVGEDVVEDLGAQVSSHDIHMEKLKAGQLFTPSY